MAKSRQLDAAAAMGFTILTTVKAAVPVPTYLASVLAESFELSNEARSQSL